MLCQILNWAKDKNEQGKVMKKRCIAIVLAGGQGKRMGTDVQKQYLDIAGKPLIYYSLQTFQKSKIIDDIVLVVGKGQIEYVRNEVVNTYGITKVSHIVEGGKERYDSVWSGLCAISNSEYAKDSYVFVHDSARPFVTEAILERAYEEVEQTKACVVGVPSKDTVKLVDDNTFAQETPNRNYVWIIQTPQVFDSELIIEAYSKMMQQSDIQVTDDAMVVEQQMKLPVKMVLGSYENIKVTTPEDLDVAEIFVKRLGLN